MAGTQQWHVREVSSSTTRVRSIICACQLTEFEAYLDLKCGLGEAPFYEEAPHSLRFVDINQEKLHIIDLNQGPASLHTFDLDVAVRLGVTIRSQ